jgi:hypothetical protein
MDGRVPRPFAMHVAVWREHQSRLCPVFATGIATYRSRRPRRSAQQFEEEFRHALRVLARSGRTLEINTERRSARRSSGVGATRAEQQSRSEATPTNQTHSPASSVTLPPWPKPAASAPAKGM